MTPEKKFKFEEEVGITNPIGYYPRAADALKKYGIVYIDAGFRPNFFKHTVVNELRKRTNLDVTYEGPSTEHHSNEVHVYKAPRNTSNSKSKFLLDSDY